MKQNTQNMIISVSIIATNSSKCLETFAQQGENWFSGAEKNLTFLCIKHRYTYST